MQSETLRAAFPTYGYNEREMKTVAGNWIRNAGDRIDKKNKIKAPDGATPGIGAATRTGASTGVECPICMDDLTQMKAAGHRLHSTTCGHLFCHPCIKRAIAITKKCPTCRQPLTAEKIRPIFA